MLIIAVCCAYQALRMANFLTHPSLNAIQTFLIVGNVLSYNMNPGVSYIFLGLTIRMAFSIGLQADSQKFAFEEQYTRQRIWWALAWQDSHFAVSYDRPTSSAFCYPSIPYKKTSSPGNRSYPESMFRIIKLTQEIIRDRTLNPRQTMTWTSIQSYKDEVARIVADGASHLREREKCLMTTQHLERLALKLHANYITSELCRPALKEPLASLNPYDTPHSANGTPNHSPIAGAANRRKSSIPMRSPNSPTLSNHDHPGIAICRLRSDCINALKETVAAYVELHGLSQFAARSWIGIQRAISAAFLLGTVPEVTQDSRVHQLLQDLERVFSHRINEDPSFTEGSASPHVRRQSSAEQVPLAEESPHWARSMTRSLQALGKMNKALNGGPSHNMYSKHPLLPRPEHYPLSQQAPHPQQQQYQYQNPQKRHSISSTISNSSAYPPPHDLHSAYTPHPPQLLPPHAQHQQPPHGSTLMPAGLAMPHAYPVNGNVGVPTGIGVANGVPTALTAGVGAGTFSAITPDSSNGSNGGGSTTGDWTLGNMTEMAKDYVSRPLWG